MLRRPSTVIAVSAPANAVAEYFTASAGRCRANSNSGKTIAATTDSGRLKIAAAAAAAVPMRDSRRMHQSTAAMVRAASGTSMPLTLADTRSG
jgi:hypothetical protein